MTKKGSTGIDGTRPTVPRGEGEEDPLDN